MPASAFKIDTREVKKNLKDLRDKQIPEHVLEGVGRAVQQLFSDSVMKSPTVPLREGTLRGSGSALAWDTKTGKEANIDVGRLVESGGRLAPSTLTRQDISLPTKGFRIIGVVGFNVPYAARLHEAPDSWHFREPSSGPKFVESKMSRYKNVYLKIIGNTMKELTNG